MRYLVLDFETRSPEPIGNGTYRYAMHPETEIICLGWAIIEINEPWWHRYTNEELSTLHYIIAAGVIYNHDIAPQFETQPCEAIYDALADDRVKVVAFNAEFDMQIYNYVGVPNMNYPPIDPMRWYCAAAQARASGCPGSLDKAVKFVTNNPQALAKDKDGRELIQRCSIPPYENNPDLMSRIGKYCLQDVYLTAWLMFKLPRLTETLQADWHVNRRINETGVPVNVTLAELVQPYAAEEIAWVNKELTELTGGAVTSHTQTKRIRGVFFEDELPAQVLSTCTVYRKGEKKFSLSKDIRRDLLAWCESNPGKLSDRKVTLLQLLDRATATSVSKFQKISDMQIDGRVHGAFIFAGAGQTLRYSSRGVQLHNLRRDCYSNEKAQEIESLMLQNRSLHDQPDNIMQILAKMLRPVIRPAPGKVLVVGDWASIEARVLPWLTLYPESHTLLGRFEKNEDVYIYAAMAIYHKNFAAITPAERQIGKIATLSLGFGGGKGALMAMAKAYGVVLNDVIAGTIVEKWRSSNTWAQMFWRRVEEILIKMVEVAGVSNMGRVKTSGPTTDEAHRLLKNASVELPCGTRLYYHHIKNTGAYGRTELQYAKSTFSARQDAVEWPLQNLWYGILCENFTQATAASLLREKLRNLMSVSDRLSSPEESFNVIAHCHDEIILECNSCAAENTRRLLKTEMETVPSWAYKLPLAAEVKVMECYGK